MEVLVVGAGAVGRWFGAIVDGSVAFADIDPDVAQAAAVGLAGEDHRAVPIDADVTVDIVCIAVPLPAASDAIAAHAPKAGAAIVDVTGAMGDPVAAMREHAPTLERASFHPLFAPEAAPGTVAVTVDALGPNVDHIREALARAGNELVDVDAEVHDRAMRTVQGGAHAAILAFALASRDEEIPEALATPVYAQLTELAERVAGGTPRVYADIQATFGGAEDVATAAERLAAADPEEFARLYESVSAEDDVG